MSNYPFDEFNLPSSFVDRRLFLGALLSALPLGLHAQEKPVEHATAELQPQRKMIQGLELLHIPSQRERHRGDILLVPGAYHGAWAYEGNLLPFFAGAGFNVYAMSLRGHGESEGKALVGKATFEDYVSDIETVLAHIGGKPILMGHSLGGLLVRRVVERQAIRAAVLLATPTPRSMRSGAIRLLFNFPLAVMKFVLQGDPDVIYRDASVVRKLLFNGASDAMSNEALGRLLRESESKRIVKEVQQLVFKRVNLPLFSLGGSADMGVPEEAIHEAAALYDGKAKIVSGAAHEFFLMPGWEEPARCIADWLSSV